MSTRRSPSGFFSAFGVATLVAGAVTGISLPFLSDPDKCTIILSRNTTGGTLGFLSAPVAQRGAASITFGITSSNGADTSTINWLAIPKNIGLGSAATLVNNASVRRPPSGNLIARGVTTLIGGTKTVSANFAFTDQAKVFVCARTFGGTSGKLSAPVATVNPATGQFVINSNQGADTSIVQWLLIDVALDFAQSGPVIGQSKGDISGSTTFSGMNPLMDTANFATEVFAAASVIDFAGTAGNLVADPLTSDGSVTAGSSAAETSLIEVLCL